MKMWLPIIMSSALVLSACGGGSDTDPNTASKSGDTDKDTISNTIDNCPSVFNTTQRDQDNDGIGDACDTSDDRDSDNDGIINEVDNCRFRSNADQRDVDGDKIGDVCDTRDDRDNNNNNKDADNDGITDAIDNCPLHSNSDQSDTDGDGTGDVCDTEDKDDKDKDGITDALDNCPDISNKDQSDVDEDGIGDVCDNIDDSKKDTDGDGVIDKLDEFPEDGTKVASVTSAHRLLTQASFGSTEDELNKIVSKGVDAWINEQLSAPSAYSSSSDAFKTHLERTIEIAEVVEPSITWSKDGIFGTGGGPIWHIRANQASAWLENALGHPTNKKHGSDQLRQRVAYSLSQLLVVSTRDPRLLLRGDSVAYYNDILAKNAFGSFRDLLGEVARSATMGVYLTYQGNRKANPENSTRPDENFAREIIQLFTIGLYELNIDGSANRDANPETYPDAGSHQVPTYTQNDVVELSKVMTGWDVKSNIYRFGYTGMQAGEYAASMEFFPEYHEDEIAEGGDGNVTVLGKTFALNSGADGSGMDAALDVLFNHPNIGPFVSKHLITNLVTSNPSPAYVARVTKVFNDDGAGHRGYMKAVIKAILTDPEARDSAQQNQNFGKVKEPFLVFTQLARAFDVKPLEGWTGPKEPLRGDGSQSTVHGVYSYIYPEAQFGQGPFRAKSVFNHYMPDFVPSESYFSENKLLAPEAQIQTDGNIINVHNTLAKFLKYYEKNRITKVSNKTMADFSKSYSLYSAHGMVINYDRELQVFEQALDGDTDGDFKNMSNALDKINAVDALIDHLDIKMLGNTMSDEYKEALRYYLVNSSNFISSKNFNKALHLISDAVRFIATSSAYMVQQ